MAGRQPQRPTGPGGHRSGRRVMRRRAADNVYLHRDFHGALNQALVYLERNFGAGAVRDYLRQFARNFYAPLRAALAERGLEALREHLESLYRTEGAAFDLSCSADELVLRVPACPAVGRIREMGLALSPQFSETTRTVNAAICEGTPFAFELVEYDEETGRRVERYFRRDR